MQHHPPPSNSRVRDLILRVAFTEPDLQHDFLSVLTEGGELHGKALIAAMRLLKTNTVLLAPRGVTYAPSEPIELTP